MYFQPRETHNPVTNSTAPFQSARQHPPASYSTHRNHLGLPHLSIPQSAGPKAVLNRQSTYPDSPSPLSPAYQQEDVLTKINFREEPGMMVDGAGDPIWKRFSKEKENSEDEKALNSAWLDAEKKSSKKLKWIGVVALVVVLGIVGGIVAWRLLTNKSGPINTQPIVPYLGGFNGVNSSSSPIFQSDTALAAVLPRTSGTPLLASSVLAVASATARAVVTISRPASIATISATSSVIPASTRRAAAGRHRRV